MNDKTVSLEEARRQQRTEQSQDQVRMPQGRVTQNVEARARTDGMFYASSLQGTKPKPRQWIVHGLIPDKAVTLFSGNGGIGKSTVMFQLAAAVASGRKWLGRDVMLRRAAYLSAEDDRDELHRRLDVINVRHDAQHGDYEDQLILWDKTGSATPFLFRDNEGWQESPFFCLLANAVVDLGIGLLVIDSMYNFFGGNELSRTDATAFMDCLQKLALEAECSIVVLWHPSASGLESGTGTSGSTAFRNRARQMLYMTGLKDEEAEEDPDGRLLRVVKSNYGPSGYDIRLRYEDGYVVAEEERQGGLLDQISEDAKTTFRREAFLHCLDVALHQGRPPSDAKNSPRYAPKMFSGMPEGRGVSRRNFEKTMEELFSDQQIIVGSLSGPDRHPIKAIIRREK
ncbi:AAA family ATPase [Paremcibacter congregatus]|uniref:AAA family ATPase n=1 Tax=Paremcibacter congregatus TaxID=2043170 RepID=UPI003A925D78